ncbi:hypothetical protein HPB49_009498 [Dermacentor silvarum]|uniref:Uncharacterized protein n=1 Tax=Dermacentor silvarum TaxID=543639 RepID=A0ACB8CK88_DERSI|nr:hypothetical protein HPB49_009498 [Dermacentor silvarum]
MRRAGRSSCACGTRPAPRVLRAGGGVDATNDASHQHHPALLRTATLRGDSRESGDERFWKQQRRQSTEHVVTPYVYLLLAQQAPKVSGHRFWGLLRELTAGGELLRGPWFVHNYCPLAFLLPSGANLTPNRLPLEARQHLQACCAAICDAALLSVLDLLRPETVVGIGCYARDRALAALAASDGSFKPLRVLCLTHPSPASPKANRGWHALALSELLSFGLISADAADRASTELCPTSKLASSKNDVS